MDKTSDRFGVNLPNMTIRPDTWGAGMQNPASADEAFGSGGALQVAFRLRDTHRCALIVRNNQSMVHKTWTGACFFRVEYQTGKAAQYTRHSKDKFVQRASCVALRPTGPGGVMASFFCFTRTYTRTRTYSFGFVNDLLILLGKNGNAAHLFRQFVETEEA